MSFIFRRCLPALLAIIVALPMTLVQAAPRMMPVDEVKAGMRGSAKTVISGTKIEEFGVEVLGVMKNKGPSGDLILVKTYGDVIERTGGIAQGMSGSPVYIDGRLVGAIAFGWPFADHKVGMVTPIADMLKLWELPEQPRQAETKDNQPSEGPEKKKSDPDMPAESPGEQKPAPDMPQAAATPLMASGFGDKALAMLTEKLKPLNLAPYAAGEAPEGVAYGPLEPGSAVGVQLVRGDVGLSAIGTATYVEDGKVLAFGHPFLKKGASGYFLTNAYIFTTVSGMENSFKVGATGQAVGRINQDRGAGVAGELNKFPNIIPMRIIINDKTLMATRDAEVQVVQDEQLSPILAAVTVYNLIDKTSDRTGPGTAKVSFELSAPDMPGGVFKRENMFYTGGNIGELAISELHELLALLASNQFKAVEIMDLKVNVDLEAERRTAAIVEARSNAAYAKPGDTVEITVGLKPFRGEKITRKVPFKIPADQLAGPMTLEVRGGGMIPLVEILSKRQPGVAGETLKLVNKMKNRTFADMLKELAERDRNNDLVVEILDLDLGSLYGGDLPEKPAKGKLDPGFAPKPEATKRAPQIGKGIKGPDKRKFTVSTDYIIDSDTQVVVNIQAPKP